MARPLLPRWQDAERDLCATLNTLAMRLLAKAEEASTTAGKGNKGKGKGKVCAASSDDEAAAAEDGDEGGAAAAAAMGRSPPAKRPRRSKSAVDVLDRDALQAQALVLLEQSFRVAEKGIAGAAGACGMGACWGPACLAPAQHHRHLPCCQPPLSPIHPTAALDVAMEMLKGMPDIAAASTSTVNGACASEQRIPACATSPGPCLLACLSALSSSLSGAPYPLCCLFLAACSLEAPADQHRVPAQQGVRRSGTS